MTTTDIKKMIVDVLSTSTVEAVKKNNGVKIVVDERSYPNNRGMFGFFSFKNNTVVLCADNIVKIAEEYAYSAEDLYFEIINTIFHECRHSFQLKMLKKFFNSSKMAKNILKASIFTDYETNPFEIDAFKFAEMFAPTVESYEVFGTYGSKEEADISLIAVLETIKKKKGIIPGVVCSNGIGYISFVSECPIEFVPTCICCWDSS